MWVGLACKPTKGIHLENSGFFRKVGRGEVFTDGFHCQAAGVEESHLLCSTAERLNPYSASATKEVQHTHIEYFTPEDVEQGFFYLVCDRTGGIPRHMFEP